MKNEMVKGLDRGLNALAGRPTKAAFVEAYSPKEAPKHRLYFVERIFDHDLLLRQFMKQNQEIRCSDCGTTYELGKLAALRL